MTRAVAGAVLALMVAGLAVATAYDAPTRDLANADDHFRAHRPGQALRSYRDFLWQYSDRPRADYATYMVGESSRAALTELWDLLPPDLFESPGTTAEHESLAGAAAYLKREYGFYAYMTEGDPRWGYDMRAYRELLKRFPKSEYADDARFQLVRERAAPTPDWGMPGARERIIEPLIREYESILRDFPKTNRAAEIRKAIAELRKRRME